MSEKSKAIEELIKALNQNKKIEERNSKPRNVKEPIKKALVSTKNTFITERNMKSLKSIQKEEINEIIKNIENKKYTIGDKRLKENLERLSMLKDTGMRSKYFGFYFLPKEIQDEYLSMDEDGRYELRIDLFDSDGYKKLIETKYFKEVINQIDKRSLKDIKEKLKINGFKNDTIKKENFNGYMVSENLFKQFFKIILDFGGLDITLRSTTLKSDAKVKVNKRNNKINIEISRRYKISDTFKKPYDIIYGLPYDGETGNSYKMTSGYKEDIIFKGEYSTEKEALKAINDKIENLEKESKNKSGKTENKSDRGNVR